MLSLTIDCLDIMFWISSVWIAKNLEATGSSATEDSKTLMQDKEENKVKSFAGFNRTCRLESC